MTSSSSDTATVHFLALSETKSYLRKEEFVKMCLNYVKENNLEAEWPCPSSFAQAKYIDIVFEAQDKMNCGEVLSSLEQSILQIYDLDADDNAKYHLVFKKDKKKVIDLFTCFDLINAAHLETNHGDSFETSVVVTKKYPTTSIPEIAVQFFIFVCDECNHDKLNERHEEEIHTKEQATSLPPEETSTFIDMEDEEKQMTNSKETKPVAQTIPFKKVHIKLINIPVKDAKQLVTVLVYVDKLSKYTLLRPVYGPGCLHLSLELFKLFADFGDPDLIETEFASLITVRETIRTIQKNFDTEDFAVDLVQVNEDSAFFANEDNLEQEIRGKLQKWMDLTKSCHLEIGCYMVQQAMNEKKSCMEDLSPHVKVFGDSDNFDVSSLENKQSPITNGFDDTTLEYKQSGENRENMKEPDTVYMLDDDGYLHPLEDSEMQNILDATDDDDSLDAFKDEPYPPSKDKNKNTNTFKIPKSSSSSSFEKSFEAYTEKVRYFQLKVESTNKKKIETKKCEKS